MNIQLHGVGKAFGAQWVFRDLNNTFLAGNSYTILGPNGSGKSTLLSLLTGFTHPTAGKITYWQENRTYTPAPCDFALASPYLHLPKGLKVSECLSAVARSGALTAQNRQILAEIGLVGMEEKLLSQLSSGMLQRVMLAMAFTKGAHVVLLDEPFNHLDSTYKTWCKAHMQAQTRAGNLLITCSNEAYKKNNTKKFADVVIKQEIAPV